MWQWLTPEERRGATVLVLILLLGAGHDACVGRRMRREMREARATAERAPLPPGPQVPDPPESAAVPRRAAEAGPRLDLNRASAGELEDLPGIGPVLAGRIVAARRERGGFASLEELLAVRGVGPRLFERLRPRLIVTPVAPPRPRVRREPPMHSAPSSSPGRADSASGLPSSSR